MSLVSIIIPCYNYGWLLAETLDSLLAQTHQAWECIIVDDGSIDDTKLVVEVYQAQDARFCYVYQANAGMSSARNIGFKHATGTYFQLLDADDLLAPRKLELQVAWLNAHPEVDITYGDVRYFRHGNSGVLSRSLDMNDVAWAHGIIGQGAAVLELLVAHNQFVINAPLLRATLVSRIGIFAEHLRSMEDWEFWLRCALAGAYFHYDDDPNSWALVRVHPVSVSQNRSRMLDFEEQVRYAIAEPLRRLSSSKASILNAKLLKQLQHNNAVYNLTQGHITEGLKTYWHLARDSGQFLTYAKGAFYWLMRRGRVSDSSR